METKVLIQAVKRNDARFPDDFMFQLTNGEFENLKSQIVTSSWGGRRRLYRLNSAQNVTISPNNCPNGYPLVSEAISAKRV